MLPCSPFPLLLDLAADFSLPLHRRDACATNPHLFRLVFSGYWPLTKKSRGFQLLFSERRGFWKFPGFPQATKPRPACSHEGRRLGNVRDGAAFDNRLAMEAGIRRRFRLATPRRPSGLLPWEGACARRPKRLPGKSARRTILMPSGPRGLSPARR